MKLRLSLNGLLASSAIFAQTPAIAADPLELFDNFAVPPASAPSSLRDQCLALLSGAITPSVLDKLQAANCCATVNSLTQDRSMQIVAKRMQCDGGPGIIERPDRPDRDDPTAPASPTTPATPPTTTSTVPPTTPTGTTPTTTTPTTPTGTTPTSTPPTTPTATTSPTASSPTLPTSSVDLSKQLRSIGMLSILAA